MKKAFINRKRRWIFIIISEQTTSLRKMLLKLHAFGNKEALSALVAEINAEVEQRDLLSLRNALLIARQSKFDPGWRMHHILYALRVIVASLLLGQQKLSRISYALRGLAHGLLGRSGKF
jgi:hypothetical protein